MATKDMMVFLDLKDLQVHLDHLDTREYLDYQDHLLVIFNITPLIHLVGT